MDQSFNSRPFDSFEKKVNLLMETRSLDRGGLEEVIFNMARFLDRNLFHIVIVCVERGGLIAERCRKIGIPVEVLMGDKEKEYREVLLRYQIDLLITHYSAFGVKIASALEIPVISFLHNIYCWMPDDIFGEMKEIDPMIDRYVAVSEDVKAYTIYRFNVAPEKIEVIPNGIDVEELEFRKGSPGLTREEAGFAETDYIFLNVAAFTPAKAHPLILAAMEEVIREHPEAKILCIGGTPDPKYEEFIRMQVRDHGLEKCVRLLNFTEDIQPYYEMANAFLLPSIIEGWSLSVMEAMSHGLPLVLTKVGGAAEVIENSDIGLLVDNRYPEIFDIDRSSLEDYKGIPANVSSLKKALLRFLEEKDYWKEAGKKAKEKVKERFDIRTVAKAYDLFFLTTVAFHGTRVRGHLVSEMENLLQERKRLSEEREQLLQIQETHLGEMGKQIQELRQLLEARYQQLDDKMEFVLLRTSIKERIRARMFKLLKAFHLLVPRKFREKYRYQYRRFCFEKIFPDRERLESPDSSHPMPSNSFVTEEVKRFIQDVKENDSPLLVVYTTDPYLQTRGQRSTWLTREFVRRGFRVIFFYWRWDPKESIVKSDDPRVLSVPIDEFRKTERQLFSPSLNQLKRIFLIEFPDLNLFEKVNLANAHSYITIYDCVDDWEEFAHVGQAVWYDPAVERYLVRNANLVLATHQRLAEKLKKMGVSSVPVIPNGVDITSLKTETATKKNLEKGVLTVGYFGHLTESWFDWDLVFRTASKQKDWMFHIIGYGEPSGLKFPDNIKFWGKVEHHDLPCYTRFWDVAIIPFRETRLTDAVDPIKLYEYLHLGLPVVATNMPHLQGRPGVFLCGGDDFESSLLLAGRTPFPQKEAEQFVQNSTWQRRVDRILEEVERIDLSQDILKNIG